MVKMKDKLKKVKIKRIKWREIIFHLHRRDISEAFDKFRVDHRFMSVNRCAYNVIKTFFCSTTIQVWKDMFENYPLVFKHDYKLVLDAYHTMLDVNKRFGVYE